MLDWRGRRTGGIARRVGLGEDAIAVLRAQADLVPEHPAGHVALHHPGDAAEHLSLREALVGPGQLERPPTNGKTAQRLHAAGAAALGPI